MPTLRLLESAIRHNITTVLSMMDGDADRWRPHLKTTKCAAVWSLLPELGITNAKCATVREARVFLDTMRALEVDSVDLVVAYPHRGPQLEALAELARTLPDSWSLSVLVEDPNIASCMPRELGVFIDLNPGMNRSGVPYDDRARIDALLRHAGTQLRGIHSYEGHLAGLEPAVRSQRADAIYESLDALLEDLELPETIEVITSGTPAFPEALRSPVVNAWKQRGWTHRVSPGTVVLHDARTIEDVPCLRTLRPAAILETIVISRPAPDLITVDAGSKSIAAECGDPVAIVLDHPELVPLRPSEEHLPIRVTDGPVPDYGTTLHLVPRHVCPTVNLAERALYERCDGSVEVIDITARAHDLLMST